MAIKTHPKFFTFCILESRKCALEKNDFEMAMQFDSPIKTDNSEPNFLENCPGVPKKGPGNFFSSDS